MVTRFVNPRLARPGEYFSPEGGVVARRRKKIRAKRRVKRRRKNPEGMILPIAAGALSFVMAGVVSKKLNQKVDPMIGVLIGAGLSFGSYKSAQKFMPKGSKVPVAVLIGTSLAYLIGYFNYDQSLGSFSPSYAEPSLSGYFGEYTTAPPSRWDVPHGVIEPGVA